MDVSNIVCLHSGMVPSGGSITVFGADIHQMNVNIVHAMIVYYAIIITNLHLTLGCFA